MDMDLVRRIRRTGIQHRLRPVPEIQQRRALEQAVDGAGRAKMPAIERLLPLLSWDWASSDTSKRRIPQPGRLVIFSVFAETPPSVTNCTVGLTLTTPWAGETTIATCEIEPDQQFGDAVLDLDVPAGGRLGHTIITASGASGITLSASMRVF